MESTCTYNDFVAGKKRGSRQNMNTKYKAEYRANGEVKFRTKYYDTPEIAQDALAKRTGYFPYLGAVSGDVHNSHLGYCDFGDRLNGRVDIFESL